MSPQEWENKESGLKKLFLWQRLEVFLGLLLEVFAEQEGGSEIKQSSTFAFHLTAKMEN